MKEIIKLAALAAVFSAMTAISMADAIQNAYPRARVSLNGKWRVIVDPYDTGFYNYRRIPYDQSNPIKAGYALDQKAKSPSDLVEYNFATSPALLVPSDWNTQDDKLFYYEGSVWYQREFSYTPSLPDSRVFIYFAAANYTADVYLNGGKLGAHTGGFTPFNFEITNKLKDGANSLVVRVNNSRAAEGVPTDSTDWWNYGGITRDVLIVETPRTFVAASSVQLSPGMPGRIALGVQLDGPDAARISVNVRIRELGFEAQLTPASDGTAQGNFSVDTGRLQLWSPETPKLYDVEITAGGDRITERIGFRTIETKGRDILLNGKPVFLRGISIHEENPLRGGRAWSEEDARLLLGWARELGCNFARLAHYPHNEHMARVADEMGIMLWEEIPVYWTIHWENPGTLANARNQLAELIRRDRNRASVIVWSVANETPVTDARTRFLGTLIADARALDGTRLISAAMESRHEKNAPDTKIIDDPLGALVDIISFNQYIGWYGSTPDQCDRTQWDVRYEKPVLVSEFGAGALEGFHAAPDVRFSEEYQEAVYRHTLPMLERMSGWRGVTPWILADFRSPRRPLPGFQDGWNRKGLIGESGAKKKAFHILRDYYAKKAAE